MKLITYLTLLFLLIILTGCRGNDGANLYITDEDGIQLIPLYKTQINIFNAIDERFDSAEEIIIRELFDPNIELVKDCFGYSDSSYVQAQLQIYRTRMDEIKKADAFFDSINFLALLGRSETSFSKQTGQKATGKFYFSFFERRICNFCGCDLNTMQMDLLVEENQDEDFLNILLPHEINHNAFELAQSDTAMQETILYKAIDEGFANFVSQKLADVSVEEAFGMSESEFQWYTVNEYAIKERVKPILFLTDEELWDPLSVKVPNSFMDGSPGNIGYYVGYRIVEEFVNKSENEEEWKNVYSRPVKQIYEESGW